MSLYRGSQYACLCFAVPVVQRPAGQGGPEALLRVPVFSFILWFSLPAVLPYASLILVLSITSATYEAFLTWEHFQASSEYKT